VFFLSADDHLLVKTIRKAEAQLLRRLLPRYYDHMMAHPNSLLVRVMGLFSVTPASGRKVRRGGRVGRSGAPDT
jgi:1-phosphatidylinositol-4-phosphate 5-kinase